MKLALLALLAPAIAMAQPAAKKLTPAQSLAKVEATYSRQSPPPTLIPAVLPQHETCPAYGCQPTASDGGRTRSHRRARDFEVLSLARFVELHDVMPPPREVLPGRFYMITRRCTQRQFLLRPDEETNNAFTYCLAEAAARFEIDVILPSAMSNHHHTVVFDRHGRVIEFITRFHRHLAKCQNALRGWWENHWSSDGVSIVHLVDRVDVIREAIYAASNPVKDGLVDRVDHWPGVNGLYPLLNGRLLHARRPAHFFRADGPMPAEVTLELTIPPELGDPAYFLGAVRDGVAAVEAEHTSLRARTGRGVLGRRRILRQSWCDSPTTHEPRRTLSPRVAARSKWHRIEALQRNRAFVAEYRAARVAWLAGLPTVFPPGTYWLRRFAGVPVAPIA